MLTPKKSFSTYSLDEEIFLFDTETKNIHRLNEVASVLWKGLNSGLACDEIAALLSQTFSIPARQIEDDLNHTISQWLNLGLLIDSTHESEAAETIRPAPKKTRTDLPRIDGVKQRLEAGAEGIRFTLAGTRFSLKVASPPIADAVLPVFAHLSSPGNSNDDILLEIVLQDERFWVYANGWGLESCGHLDEIAPLVHHLAIMAAYDRADCLFGLHAAAVMRNNRSILLPAASGSGKSTLTAALVSFGFKYMADDLLLLTRPPVKIVPMPVSISLKAKSWPLLEGFYPELAALRIHHRVDGKAVRFLSPPDGMFPYPRSDKYRIDFIAFPKYIEGCQSELTGISKAEGLYRFAEAGYDAHGDLNTESVQQLVDWISKIDCYEFRFDGLDDAIAALTSLTE